MKSLSTHITEALDTKRLPKGWEYLPTLGSWLERVLIYRTATTDLRFSEIDSENVDKYDKALKQLSKMFDAINKTLSKRIELTRYRHNIMFRVHAEIGDTVICKIGTIETKDITNVRYDMFTATINLSTGKIQLDKKEVEQFMHKQIQNFISGNNDNYLAGSIQLFLTVAALTDYLKVKPKWLTVLEMDALYMYGGHQLAKLLADTHNLKKY